MEGSSEANPYIDSSVGALVWVRRRNGSWWPGRILGPEELPGSHLLSPRTGTPVKLLGREDGSVDWYNIEKSRRVKAFRCGDFDECIERAKSLASVLTKKREKYARREDAILHALELEKKYIEQSYLLRKNFQGDGTYKHMSIFTDDDMDGMANHSDFQSDFMDPESSADATQASFDSIFSLQGDKKFLDADWEDDITDTLPRMRGLQDFGLKIASSKERKASWSVAYEHDPHISFLEDDQKIASCVTRNTATFSAPISSKTSGAVGVSKRKRSSQGGYLEEESALKKRDRGRQIHCVLESSAKGADGAVDLGSKVSAPYIVPSMSRNGSTLLQPKQENNAVILGNAFQGSSEIKPLTSVCGQEIWPASQIESLARHELLDSSPVMDKACSSFSNHIKLNCCDGRQYIYADSQMEATPLTGPAFPDPFLQGAPAPRSSLFPRYVYPGSVSGVNDNGFHKSGSISAPENTCSSLSGFPIWPYYGGPREVFFEKFGHEMSLRGQVASGRTVGFPDYSFESTAPNTAMPMYSLYNNSLEDNSTFAKNNAGDRDSSLLLTKGIIKDDNLKPPLQPPEQCLSYVADGDGATDEDEADSVQPPQDPFVGLPKAIGSRDAHCVMKPKHASDGFCDIPGYHETKSVTTRNGFASTEGLWNGRLNDDDDDTDIHGYTSRNRLSNDCSDFPFGSTRKRWQAKGRRGLRVPCRSSWVSPAAGIALTGMATTTAVPDVLEEMQEDFDIAPSDPKGKNRTARGVLYFNFDSSSEEEEPFKLRPSSHPPAYHNRFDMENVQSLDVLGVHNSTWFEVPVEEDEVRNAPCHEHIPVVSMMSMLKGKPIVGYAVHVEIVEKRYEASHRGSSRPHSSGNAVRKPPLQHPVWRTGRRTAMQRVPRSCGIVVSRDFDSERHHQSKHCSLQNRGPRKSSFSSSSSAEKRKSSSKKLGLVPQKTRMLSSIGGGDDAEHDATRNVGVPLVTCIPVNVIFSRIREVLYRGVNHGASDSDNVS